ncbi:hypothetical protein [Kutzneria kofuensis]|uniref:DUF2637 domain-containing protein n=1 Tax=Kutzneria kofuensis TaxID=103725 RepID=A0A7W9KDK4_9PSEU|nr:hypothetical protein [Kutzneria kofuensis]MBB5890591.1 hypothetical protein [Kutzneria kofuensis]
MATELTTRMQPAADQPVVVRAVTVIMGTVVGLTFMFGFGNVLNLALRLGVPIWVAPLVAPAVDLSIFGLLLGTRHLAIHGATPEQLRPARRLLIFASLATLALNIADPITAGDYGKAAFDAVGPLLLIGWAEVGPGLLQAITAIGLERSETRRADSRSGTANTDDATTTTITSTVKTGYSEVPVCGIADRPVPVVSDGDLVDRARQEDARHWAAHQRPISAETLRRNLHIGAARSRMLVSIIRAERFAGQDTPVAMVGQSNSG